MKLINISDNTNIEKLMNIDAFKNVMSGDKFCIEDLMNTDAFEPLLNIMLPSPGPREEFIEKHKQFIYEVCAVNVLRDENAYKIASYVYSRGTNHSEQAKRFDYLYDRALFESFCLIRLDEKQNIDQSPTPKTCQEFIEKHRYRIYEICAGKVLHDENGAEIASFVYSKGTEHKEQANRFDCLYYEALNDLATELGFEKDIRKSWLKSEGIELLNRKEVE